MISATTVTKRMGITFLYLKISSEINGFSTVFKRYMTKAISMADSAKIHLRREEESHIR